MVREPKFNLLDEPWLEVTTRAGNVQRLGILECLRRSAELRGLGQDMSTQRFVVLRLLLAFLHRAMGGPTTTAWNRAWKDGLPQEAIDAYAAQVRDRFWLVHPSQPFFQTPTLRSAKGPEAGLRKIVADIPDGEPFFTNRTAADVARLEWPEAALWLVHAQGYDTAGIKTGALGDPLVSAGKGYGYGLPSWAGQIGGVSAVGANLQETLLLNLIPDSSPPDDQPAWERPVPTAWRGDSTETQQPVTGPVHLMTWQSRRILLEWDGDLASGLTLCQGDRITPQEPPMHPVEKFTSWRYSKPQTQKFGHPIFMPQQHDSARQAWRGLSQLLGVPREPREGDPEVSVPICGLVEHLAKLEMSTGHSIYTLELSGYLYGGQNATYADLIDDSVGVPALLIGGKDTSLPWRTTVSLAVDEAEKVAHAVRRLAENLAIASGQDRPELPEWQERCFAALDQPIREWITHLDVGNDRSAAHLQWRQACRAVAASLADDLLSSLGLHAHAGHASGPDSDPITPALACAWFQATLAKVLGPRPTTKEGT